MADVLVQVQQNVKGSDKVEAAAGAMAKLAAQEAKLNKLSLTSGKQQNTAVGKVTSATKALGGETKKTAVSTEKLAGVINDIRGGNLLGITSKLGSGAGAAGLASVAIAGIGVAAVGAAVGMVALGAKIASVALEAKAARDESLGLLRVLAKGDASVPEKLAGTFDKLGVPLDVGTKKLQQLTDAGLRGSDALAALKLGADLKIGSSGSEAVLSKISALGSEYSKLKDEATSTNAKIAADAKTKLAGWPETYKAKLAEIATQMGVTGTGADAAARKMSTLAGAAYRIDKVKGDALVTLGGMIEKPLDRAASKVADLIEAFGKSPAAQKLMGELAASITWVADKVSEFANAVTRDLPIYQPLIDKMITGFKVVGAVIGVAAGIVIGAIGAAAIVVGAAATAIGAAVGLVSDNWDGMKNAVIGAIDRVVNGVSGFVASVVASVAATIGAVTMLKDRFVEAGANIVQGIIDGVTGAAGRLLASVGDLASRAVNKFKSVLGIASPSKVFTMQGEFVGEGAAIGIKNSVPKVASATDKIANAAIEPFKPYAGGGVGAPSLGSDVAPSLGSMPSPSTGKSGDVHFHFGDINISGVQTDNPQELARSVRREIEAMLEAMSASVGLR
jgi:hypothetical protein